MNFTPKHQPTKLKQMSITDSFKKAKLANFRVEKTFYTSEYVISIDSDSDENEQKVNNSESCRSIKSKCSDKTVDYEYSTDIIDSCSIPVSLGSAPSVVHNNEGTERLILNCPEDAQDSSQNAASESCSISGNSRQIDECETSKLSVKKRLSFNSNITKVKRKHPGAGNTDTVRALKHDKKAEQQVKKIKNDKLLKQLDIQHIESKNNSLTINLTEQRFIKKSGIIEINKSKQEKAVILEKDKQDVDNENYSMLPKISCSSSPNVTPTKKLEKLDSKENNPFESRQLTEIKALFKIVTENKKLLNLLPHESKRILAQFLKMEETHQYFVIKLFLWKKNWYNVSKFCTKAKIFFDENRILEVFKLLYEFNFVLTDYKELEPMKNLLKLLDKKQVKQIMDELKITPNKGTKDALIQNIYRATTMQPTLSKVTLKDLVLNKIGKKMGFAIKLDDTIVEAFQSAYLLATFANPDMHKIEDYFKNIIYNKLAYPVTTLEDHAVFSSKDTFLAYAHALKISEKMDQCLAKQSKEEKKCGIHNIGLHIHNLLQSLDPNTISEHASAPHLKRFTAAHVYLKILTMCCEKMFTKQNGFPDAVKIWLEYLIKSFPNSRRIGTWYKILIWLNMRHLEPISYETGAKLLLEVFESKGDLLGDRAKAELGQLGHTLKSSKKFTMSQLCYERISGLIPNKIDPAIFPHKYIDSRCLRSNILGKKRVYILRGEGETTYKTVEDVALHYYKKNGFTGGEKCEGSLLKGLMILVFWDIIYKPQTVIPGIFVSKFQKAPLDFMTRYFFENRREAINVRLREIEFEWSEEILVNFATRSYKEHSHEFSAFGVIQNIIQDVAIVKILLSVINRKVLVKIFERLITNTGEFSSGMPDLLIWDVEKQLHKFVEVKGEGDQLSISQKLWLNYLQDIGASVELCIVHSIGSKRKKAKKRHSDESDIWKEET